MTSSAGTNEGGHYGRVFSLSFSPPFLDDFKEDEEEKINDITDNIVKQLPTLIEKKIDLFSSKVNQDLHGI